MSSIDLETHALIAKLALEDLEALYGRRWGKARVDHIPSDEEVALRLQAEQFQHWITMAEDARMANSLHEASESDVAFLEAHGIAERAAVADRQAALALSRGLPLPPPTEYQSRLEDPTFNLHPDSPSLQKANNGKSPEIFGQDEDEEASDNEDDDSSTITIINNQLAIARNAMIQRSFGTSSMAGPSVKHANNASCVVCDDKVSIRNSLHTPCGHFYCRDCAVDLVQAFTRDESLYPLRCCQATIPANLVVPFISLNLRNTFNAKNAEWSVLAKDRIYCCSPTCSAFLGSSVEQNHLLFGIACTSRNCRTSTCPRCKQVAHPNELDCSANRASDEVRALAREQGWQTCPGCNTIVELHVGCYHMTCRCRTQFCYVCAVVWKGCTCPQWDENRLVATAEQRLENQIGARAIQMRNDAPQQFQQRVRRVAEDLRVNHNCVTHSWRYRSGGGRCEECHYMLPSYLLICTRCSLLACVRCSRNRL